MKQFPDKMSFSSAATTRMIVDTTRRRIDVERQGESSAKRWLTIWRAGMGWIRKCFRKYCLSREAKLRRVLSGRSATGCKSHSRQIYAKEYKQNKDAYSFAYRNLASTFQWCRELRCTRARRKVERMEKRVISESQYSPSFIQGAKRFGRERLSGDRIESGWSSAKIQGRAKSRL